MPRQGSKKQSSVTKSKTNTYQNQEDVYKMKRTPSSPQGGPKKRSAFIDLTNTTKTHTGIQMKSGKTDSRAPDGKVICRTHAIRTDSKDFSSDEQPKKAEFKQEDSPLDGFSVCQPDEPSAIQEQKVPEEFDIDKEHAGDCFMSPEYAKEIFDYLKIREEKFILSDYMHNQPDLNQDMRAILIDWMVELQENFELNHETLYLAVKITDHYLSVTVVMRELLQLIGSTAMLIAAKFEERCPPCVDDFLYICDDAYKRQELIAMEMNILRGLNFDINIPVPYRFLRRYAKVAHVNMKTLTLARYVCESSLLEVELVSERASRLASACLLLALITQGLGGWTPALQYHSGYLLVDLSPLVRKLYAMLASPSNDKLKAVDNKYSHRVFFEVAKIPLVHTDTLEEALMVI
ncbi:G2/mitotic-specific cyclin-B3-like [Myxocyprinus asiaticus]|uniref:G2/mitotic-specific cyclin-B3-like n=1 Tax=Myxocyprinus asiaticus TaxID=70543 RepID=UPI0022234377|nr:G2/mitotic-specific cyclin-B3-like [Myxocyprinus asiaticus]